MKKRPASRILATHKSIYWTVELNDIKANNIIQRQNATHKIILLSSISASS